MDRASLSSDGRIATIVLIALFDSATYGDLQMIGNAPYSPNRMLTITLSIIMLSPLAFRRRFPEGSALAMAVLSAVQLLFLPSILTINMFSMVSVYSAVLYGRESAWRWVSVALAADSWLAGIKVMTGWNGYSQLFHLFLPDGSSMLSKWKLVFVWLAAGRGNHVGRFCLHCDGSMEAFAWRKRSGAVATRGGAASRAGAAKGAGGQLRAQPY